MSNLKAINEVKNMIVKAATENGIDLADQFETPEAFKRFVLAFIFKNLRDLGVPTNEAFDLTFGEGQYEELVHNVWTAAQTS